MQQYKHELITHLSGFVTPQRLAQFRKVVQLRTRYLTVLLEDIYQAQNASAVLRTCDGTGIQDVHIVEQRNAYEVNPDVALGSDRWLSLHYYRQEKDPLESALSHLKKKGYRLVATSPHREGSDPDSFDLEKGKAALMFGTELKGLSENALQMADEYVRIPMMGFTESFNISVSAAIILHRIMIRLQDTELKWRLDEAEQSDLLLQWLRASIKMSDRIEQQFYKDYSGTF